MFYFWVPLSNVLWLHHLHSQQHHFSALGETLCVSVPNRMMQHRHYCNSQYLSKSFTHIIKSTMQSVCMTDYILTVAPSLMEIGLGFFPIWPLMLKPILVNLLGAGGSAEDSSSASAVRCWDVRLTAAAPPTVLQETGLVFTLPPSSCGPAWGKTTHQGEQLDNELSP